MIPVAPLLRAIVGARARGAETAPLAAAFHEALAARLSATAAAFARRLGLRSVVLTGGCFQNRRLLEAVSDRLASFGLEVLVHRRLPPGDGGLAAGQAVVALACEGKKQSQPQALLRHHGQESGGTDVGARLLSP